MSKPSKRSCVWCGNPRVTKEHVFGAWMRDMLPEATFTFTRRLPDGTEIAKKISFIELKTKHVCRACNTNWGSDLEGRAKDALQNVLLQEVQHTFSVAHCKAIADLAFKATVLANAMSRAHSKSFFTDRERKRFATDQTIPPGIQVWIAMRGTKYMHATFRSAHGLGNGTKPLYRFETYTCTFAFGLFIIQLLATRWTNHVMREFVPPFSFNQDPTLDAHLIPIFPDLRVVQWPPYHVVGDHQMDWFWQRFNRINIPTSWME